MKPILYKCDDLDPLLFNELLFEVERMIKENPKGLKITQCDTEGVWTEITSKEQIIKYPYRVKIEYDTGIKNYSGRSVVSFIYVMR